LGSISNVGGVTVTLVGNQIRISFDTAGDQFDSIVGFGIVPEQQIIDFGNPPKFPAGFSILEYQGERTAPPNPNTPLPPSPTPAEVDAALDQLSTIAAVGGVTVTAVAGQPGQMRVTFDVAGDVPDAITGINYNPEAQVIDLNPIVGTNATLTLSFNGESTGALSENSTAAEIDAALDALVTIMAEYPSLRPLPAPGYSTSSSTWMRMFP